MLDQYFFRPKQLFGSYIKKWNNIYFKYKPFDGILIDNFFYLNNKYFSHIILSFLSFFKAIVFVSASFILNKWILSLIWIFIFISLILDFSRLLNRIDFDREGLYSISYKEAHDFIGSELNFKKFLVKIPFSLFNPYSLLDVFTNFHFLTKKISMAWAFPIIFISIFNFWFLNFIIGTMKRNSEYSFL